MSKSDRVRKIDKLKLFSWLIITMFLGFWSNEPFNIASQKVMAQSQIVPDNTLEGENSTVTPNQNINDLPSELIEGGAQRGNNLFHSFSEFNVESGRGAYFANPNGITNIFSRVTGANASEIMGTLGVNGNADLFLINPNGIIFGENASLDINGSFVSTTADAIQFGKQGFLNATEPNAPPLLTVQPSAFFFNQMNSGRIENRAIAPAGSNILGWELFGLRVADGESLILVGGEIAIDRGWLHALDGRIELSAVASGNIELDKNENNLTLTPTDQLQLANISINKSFINTSNEGGGEISLQGKSISITNGSSIAASTLGDLDGRGISIAAENLTLNTGSSITADVLSSRKGGNINIDTKTLDIADDSTRISTNTFAQGDGGNIDLQVYSLSLTDNSFISTNTFAQGDGGNIDINATETIFIDVGDIVSEITPNATGSGGNISIGADSLSLTNDALISTNTFAQGDGGNIDINATKTISIDTSRILSGTFFGSTGNGGDINLTTGSLSVISNKLFNENYRKNTDADYEEISTSISGQGDGGNININATDTIFIDTADITSNINLDAIRNGGDINLSANSFSVTGDSLISTNTFGQGDGGNIDIDATETISIDVGDIVSEISPDAIGSGGDINLTTGSLSLTNDALISTNTFGQGDGGNIDINATKTISIDTSRILSGTFFGSTGNGGDINLTTGSLSVIGNKLFNENYRKNTDADYEEIYTSISGQGDGGNININATETISIDVGNIVSEIIPNATGNGGDINLTTGSLSLTNDALISTSISGQGDGGNIDIDATETISIDTSRILSEMLSNTIGNGGNINLNANSFSVTGDSLISTSISGRGDGGNINIDATDTISIEDRSKILSEMLSNAIVNGGDINLSADSLSLTDDFTTRTSNSAKISTTTFGQGDGGNININVAETIFVNVGDIISEISPDAIGSGGDININADSLSLTNDALISTNTFSREDGENIDFSLFPNQSQAGNIEINVGKLSVQNGGRIEASTYAQANAGNLTVNASESIELRGDENLKTGLFVSSENSNAAGNGGNLNITTTNLEISDRAEVKANASGEGNGGNIDLQISEILRLQNNSSISATAVGKGTGGNGGNIDIDAQFIIASPLENNDIIANAFQGNGGNINIQAQGIFGIGQRQGIKGDVTNNTTNDIDSSSELGVSGQVKIDVLDVDLSGEKIELPARPIETEVIRICEFDSFKTQNNFFISGRSGLPDTPKTALNADIGWEDWQIGEFESTPSSPTEESREARSTDNEPQIQEAQSWIINERGKVQLIASSTANSTPELWHKSSKCQS